MDVAEFSPRQRRILEYLGHRPAARGSRDDWVLIDSMAKAFAMFPDHMVAQIFMLEARGLVDTPPVPFPIRCRLTPAGRELFRDRNPDEPSSPPPDARGPTPRDRP